MTEAINVLKRATISFVGEDCILKLSKDDDGMPRDLYNQVDKVLKTWKGRWKKGTGHIFPFDITDTLANYIESDGKKNDIKEDQWFYTPTNIADYLCELAEFDSSVANVLEPSAGLGHIADRIEHYRKSHDLDFGITCIEKNEGFVKKLDAKGFNVPHDDFMQFKFGGWDRIIMNPPFAKGAEVDHFLHACELVAVGGIVVSVLSNACTFRTDGKYKELRKFLQANKHVMQMNQAGAFKEAGTGVQTCIIKITKPLAGFKV